MVSLASSRLSGSTRRWANRIAKRPSFPVNRRVGSEAGSARHEESLRDAIYQRARALHRKVYEGVWFAEMANIGADGTFKPAQRGAMLAWFKEQLGLMGSKIPDEWNPLEAWHYEVTDRVLPVASADREGLADVLHKIWDLVHRDNPNAVLPEGADLRLLPHGAERLVELRWRGDSLSAGESLHEGSPVALIRTCQSRIKIEPLEELMKLGAEFWRGGEPPVWADEWGWDSFGAWVTFRVGEVVQRMRWIPPGTFLMGSPEGEEGRWDDEGPRHEEAITQGFWMFDTPCAGVVGGSGGEQSKSIQGDGSPCRKRELERLPEFRRAVEGAVHGLGIVAADGGAMGICLPCGDGDAALSREP